MRKIQLFAFPVIIVFASITELAWAGQSRSNDFLDCLEKSDLAACNRTVAAQHNAFSYRLRADEYIKRGDINRAMADLEQAIRLDPSDDLAYSKRAELHLKKGDRDHAVADLVKALKLDPRRSDVSAELVDLVGAEKRAELMGWGAGTVTVPAVAFDDAPRLPDGNPEAKATVPERKSKIEPGAQIATAPSSPGAKAELVEPDGRASGGRRVSLVIGNGQYENVAFLANPINDATDLSAALRRLNFSTKTIINAKYDDMRRALIDFGRDALGADLAVVFFAGHGIEMGGENWLIPVDARLTSDLDVSNEAIGLQAVVRAVSNTTKLGLVVLDACRSNPFVPRMRTTSLTRAVDRGFSRIEPSDNVLVAYAARDGTTASDGSGRNSPFMQSLLKHIESPGLEITFLFRNVRDDVMVATNKQQQPYIYGSLSKEQIFLTPPPRPSGSNSSAAYRE